MNILIRYVAQIILGSKAQGSIELNIIKRVTYIMIEEYILKIDSVINDFCTSSIPVPSYMCTFCNISFKNKSLLANHIRWHHKKLIKYKCDICNKEFNSCCIKTHKKLCQKKKICLQCGIPLVGKDKKKFCSQSCSAKYNNTRRVIKLETKEVICKLCKNTFIVNNHCRDIGNICPSCKIIQKNKKVIIKNLISVKKNSFCLNCGKELKNYKKYCSSECNINYRKTILYNYIEEKGGIGVSPRAIKKYLIEKNGNMCSICKNMEWLGQPIPLVLDHINGRSSETHLKNLRLVCGNCDMQLPTYKSKNKNSDRKFRRKRKRKLEIFTKLKGEIG